jgi:hypothetical protein
MEGRRERSGWFAERDSRDPHEVRKLFVGWWGGGHGSAPRDRVPGAADCRRSGH